MMVVHATKWEEGPGEAHVAWAEAANMALAPLALGGLYVNFMSEGTPREIQAAYAGNYERLRALKAEYDPQNCFSRNQNITPAARRGL
jgi:FAD/FMN-containing dehydrogenase